MARRGVAMKSDVLVCKWVLCGVRVSGFALVRCAVCNVLWADGEHSRRPQRGGSSWVLEDDEKGLGTEALTHVVAGAGHSCCGAERHCY